MPDWTSPMFPSSRCYLKLGEWQEGLHGLNETSIPQVIQYYSEATKHDKVWYKAWHAFAYLNYEAVNFYKQQKAAGDSSVMTPGDIAGKAPNGNDDNTDVSK